MRTPARVLKASTAPHTHGPMGTTGFADTCPPLLQQDTSPDSAVSRTSVATTATGGLVRHTGHASSVHGSVVEPALAASSTAGWQLAHMLQRPGQSTATGAGPAGVARATSRQEGASSGQGGGLPSQAERDK